MDLLHYALPTEKAIKIELHLTGISSRENSARMGAK